MREGEEHTLKTYLDNSIQWLLQLKNVFLSSYLFLIGIFYFGNWQPSNAHNGQKNNTRFLAKRGLNLMQTLI